MSDKPYFHEPNHTIHLRVWALGQMVWGAFLGGLFLAVIAAVLIGIWIVGQLLPEQSKQAPSPYSAIVIESPERSA
ncbi:RC-LH1 core complex protein PufX [Neotabrizicola shimadae]|uniref:RC-LH1 core complex protein PufX n=1 Tax=Neotabrizicola shimadae TaxID=2807096 RepID=A0A8G0ZSN7_9RHOB|nr:RC-LH1 core complex protein PufX [Neotabrizicola shimadae]QYZ69317.1 RC-LH1 core complex protein PufX [Neotabrizicola shimadae]